jgi:hypothetical protein
MTTLTKYPDYTRTFAEVYLAELDYVKKRRDNMNIAFDTIESESERVRQEIKELTDQNASENNASNEKPAPIDVKISTDAGLVGLALSGGGIRSATFNLGLLQTLDKRGILRYCDYLSTVSGGGYIGSCLSSLLTNPKASTDSLSKKEQFPFRFQRDSDSDERKEVKYQQPSAPANSYEERREVSYLRAAKDYLGLEKGLFSLDTWRFIAMFLSGLVLINLVPVVLALLIAYSLFVIESPIARYTCAKGDSQIVALINQDPKIQERLAQAETIDKLRNGKIQLKELEPVKANKPLADKLANKNIQLKLCSYREIKKSDITKSETEYQKIKFSQEKSHQEFKKLLKHLFWLALFAFLAMMVIRILAVLRNWNGTKITGLQALLVTTTATLVVVAGLIAATYYLFLDKNGTVDEHLFEWLNYTLLAAFLFFILGRLNTANKFLKTLLNLMMFTALMALIPIVFAQFLRFLWEFDVLTAPVSAFLPTLIQTQIFDFIPTPIFACLILLTISLFVNINRISLHAFYRDSLRKTYLIKRENGKIKYNGDLKLKNLHKHHNGPYHLINATLNLQGSKNRHLSGRGADFFIFSKLYCGAETTGYRRTESYKNGQTDLSAAMAISGGAASPAMGTHTNPLMAFYMILFNIRLNVWMPNPNPKYTVKMPLWPYYFLKEFLRFNREQDSLLNLSDGGHHENLGVYPLLKRRCRMIIISDAASDPHYKMTDLANLQRKARIDLGINIELDMTPLRPNQERYTEMHCVKGTIHYPNDKNGVLFYIKTTMTGKEPEDLLAYRRSSPSFPDETTANQFFNEDQFESYRKLGEIAGKEVCPEIEEEIQQTFETDSIISQ